jgi:hypothetical protein
MVQESASSASISLVMILLEAAVHRCMGPAVRPCRASPEMPLITVTAIKSCFKTSQLALYDVTNRFKMLIHKLHFTSGILLFTPFGASRAVQNRFWRLCFTDLYLVSHSPERF